MAMRLACTMQQCTDSVARLSTVHRRVLRQLHSSALREQRDEERRRRGREARKAPRAASAARTADAVDTASMASSVEVAIAGASPMPPRLDSMAVARSSPIVATLGGTDEQASELPAVGTEFEVSDLRPGGQWWRVRATCHSPTLFAGPTYERLTSYGLRPPPALPPRPRSPTVRVSRPVRAADGVLASSAGGDGCCHAPALGGGLCASRDRPCGGGAVCGALGARQWRRDRQRPWAVEVPAIRRRRARGCLRRPRARAAPLSRLRVLTRHGCVHTHMANTDMARTDMAHMHMHMHTLPMRNRALATSPIRRVASLASTLVCTRRVCAQRRRRLAFATSRAAH